MGKHLRKAGLLATMCLCAAVSASAQPGAEAGPPQSVVVSGLKNASKWFKAESQHFVVYSDTRQEDVTQLLDNLEKLDFLLRAYTKSYNTGGPAKQKITLYYHGRMGGFQEVVGSQPDEAVGLYNSCGAGVQGFAVNLERIDSLNNAQLVKAPLNASLSYIFEAYTRHFLYRYTDIRRPTSYIDGFAQYFSSVRFSENQTVIGRAPTGVGRYLYFLDQGRRYKLAYSDIFEPAGAKGMDTAGETGVRLEFLGKSWLLTHYMLSSAANRNRLDQYLELIHRDVPATKAFEEAFGVKATDIDTTLWRYRLKGIEVAQVDLPALPSAQISFTSLPESSTDFVLADAALKSCPERTKGEALLRTMSRHAGGVPNNDLPKLALSRAQIDWGNPADALPYLNEATAKDASNFDGFYLLGLANLRLSEQGKESDKNAYLEVAKRHLARARKLRPASAEAAFALYKAELSGIEQPGEPAMEGAVSAWKNAREVGTFARAAALVYAYSKRAPEADHVLTLLANNARDPDMAAWAKEWQKRLNSGVRRSELLAEMRREPSQLGAFKEWTVASENLMQSVQNNAGIEDARGYFETLRLGDPAAAQALGNTPVLTPRKQ